MFTPFDILSIESWILLGTVVLLIRYYIHRQWQVLQELGVPHDPPSILGLGNLRTIFKNPDEFFKMDLENKKKFGKIYGSYSGFEPHITVWDPEVLKQIQVKDFWHFRNRQRAFSKLQGKYMNTSLTATGDDQWKRIRTTISPVFSTSKLKEMFGLVVQCTDHMIENLKKKSTENDGKIDAKQLLGKLSLDVICSAAFGVNVHSQEEGKEPKALTVSKKLFDTKFFAKPLNMIFLISPWAEKIGEFFKYSIFPKDFIAYFPKLINAVIEQKRSLGTKAYLDWHNIFNYQGDVVTSQQQRQVQKSRMRVDILKCLLDTEIDEKDIEHSIKGISRNELVGNSVLMIMAGYETTSGTMLFVTYNLAVYKECQEKLRQEIKETVEKYGGLTYEAINSMKYLMMCINESLRLYPALPRNSRLCEEEITIDGIRFPKGAHIDVPNYGLTRDPEHWDEPMEFRPERMEDMSKIDPLVFQPFGAGPRICIAMRFALMEVKMAICKIIQNFQLDVADDTPEPPVDIIFRGSMRTKADVLNIRAIPL